MNAIICIIAFFVLLYIGKRNNLNPRGTFFQLIPLGLCSVVLAINEEDQNLWDLKSFGSKLFYAISTFLLIYSLVKSFKIHHEENISFQEIHRKDGFFDKIKNSTVFWNYFKINYRLDEFNHDFTFAVTVKRSILEVLIIEETSRRTNFSDANPRGLSRVWSYLSQEKLCVLYLNRSILLVNLWENGVINNDFSAKDVETAIQQYVESRKNEFIVDEIHMI